MDKPDRKVTVGAAAGAFSFLMVLVLNQYLGAELPAEAAVALTTLVTFVASYLVPKGS